mmetsp:Transcript_63095/g.162464  ORF Transcript_63095/g.162464 Transcript_63095/m.162464 type:complete len:201 (-) Transcript_63095:686-1288(-)
MGAKCWRPEVHPAAPLQPLSALLPARGDLVAARLEPGMDLLVELRRHDPASEDPWRRHGGAGRLPAQRGDQRPPQRDLWERGRNDHHGANSPGRTAAGSQGDAAGLGALQPAPGPGHVLLLWRPRGDRWRWAPRGPAGRELLGVHATGAARRGGARHALRRGEGADLHREQCTCECDHAPRVMPVVRAADHLLADGVRGR